MRVRASSGALASERLGVQPSRPVRRRGERAKPAPAEPRAHHLKLRRRRRASGSFTAEEEGGVRLRTLKTCPAPFPASEATCRSDGLVSPQRVKGATRIRASAWVRGRRVTDKSRATAEVSPLCPPLGSDPRCHPADGAGNTVPEAVIGGAGAWHAFLLRLRNVPLTWGEI
jgi:hypothetical protein